MTEPSLSPPAAASAGSVTPSPRHRTTLSSLGRLMLKELRESLRDRRTLMTLLLMPVLVYPLLSIAFQQFFLASTADEQGPVYFIALRNEEENHLFVSYLQSQAPRRFRSEVVEGGLRMLMAEGGARLEIHFHDDLEELIGEGKFDVGIRLKEPQRWQAASLPRRPFPRNLPYPPAQDLALECELLYRKDSPPALEAAEFVERWLLEANAGYLDHRLQALGVRNQSPQPARAQRKVLAAADAGSSFSLATFIPLVLILMTITGAVYPAIDLTAGERERGTLEILVAAPVPRLGLLLAKYVAVVTVAVLTALANLTMMTVTLGVTGLIPVVFPHGLSALLIAEVLGLLLLFAAFFSAVLLILTSFARSFKEAQAYLVPLMLLALAPGMLALMPSIKLTGLWAVTPLANTVLLARDLFAGQASPALALVVIVSTLLYAAAALAAAAQLFGDEAVLYSEQSTWGDLFRRPARPGPAPTVVNALLCVAVIFPVYFYLINLIARQGELPGSVHALLAMAVAVLGFVVIPAAAAYLGRVRWGGGFLLRPPPWSALAGALLLGVSLWPLAYELGRGLHALGLLPAEDLPPELLEKLRRWREDAPGWTVAALVGMAVVEELFFRGYLFSALRTWTNARTTLLVSALLFGLFHLIAPSPRPAERFLVTTLLGLLLGWVCWRTGSIFPGMLLHVCHNTVGALTEIYQGELANLGWDVGAQGPLPWSWLAGAVVAAAAGVFLVGLRFRSPPSPAPADKVRE
jgi:ABC-2 type transport system permease protein/sodium transport system permease protein